MQGLRTPRKNSAKKVNGLSAASDNARRLRSPSNGSLWLKRGWKVFAGVQSVPELRQYGFFSQATISVLNWSDKLELVLRTMTFSDVIEAIKGLSTEEKQEIQLLLKQYLREERREEIYENFKVAQMEQQKGELKFSSNIDELRKLIEN